MEIGGEKTRQKKIGGIFARIEKSFEFTGWKSARFNFNYRTSKRNNGTDKKET
jgi:predicted alpha/beta-hydrolase family hydrolase